MMADRVLTLEVAIDRYVASVEGAGYSPHSVRSYATRLNDFARAVGPDQPVPIGPETIQDYLASLRRRAIGRRVGVSAQTLSHAYAILSGFHRYLERTLRIEPNPMRDVLKPRVGSSVDNEFASLTVVQLDDLLNTALHGWPRELGPADLRSDARRAEDLLLVSLMALAGLRVSEVCGLDVTDVDGDVLRVLGKGRKRRSVPMVSELRDALAKHAAPGPHLFGMPRSSERRITSSSIEQRVPRLARRAGIFELRVTPHVLRHTFGSLMLAADPTALIPTRDLMGHESIETTNKYAHTREEDRRLALASLAELRSRKH